MANNNQSPEKYELLVPKTYLPLIFLKLFMIVRLIIILFGVLYFANESYQIVHDNLSEIDIDISFDVMYQNVINLKPRTFSFLTWATITSVILTLWLRSANWVFTLVILLGLKFYLYFKALRTELNGLLISGMDHTTSKVHDILGFCRIAKKPTLEELHSNLVNDLLNFFEAPLDENFRACFTQIAERYATKVLEALHSLSGDKPITWFFYYDTAPAVINENFSQFSDEIIKLKQMYSLQASATDFISSLNSGRVFGFILLGIALTFTTLLAFNTNQTSAQNVFKNNTEVHGVNSDFMYGIYNATRASIQDVSVWRRIIMNNSGPLVTENLKARLGDVEDGLRVLYKVVFNYLPEAIPMDTSTMMGTAFKVITEKTIPFSGQGYRLGGAAGSSYDSKWR